MTLKRVLQLLFGRSVKTIFQDPRIGRRFCKVDMRGCMAQTRGQEWWGIVIAVGEDRSNDFIVRPVEVRNLSQRNRQRSLLKVRYENGEELWEPYWWCFDHGGHLEYQI